MKTINIKIPQPVRLFASAIIPLLTVVATIAFASGGVSVYGKTATVFSAIDMSLEIFEITFDTIYDSIVMTLLGIIYIVFLIQAVVMSVKNIKIATGILEQKGGAKNTDCQNDAMLNNYFKVIASIFMYIVLVSIFNNNSVSLVSEFLIYCGIGIYFILYCINYLATNPFGELSHKIYVLAGSAIGIICVVFLSRTIDAPIIKDFVDNIASEIEWPENVKGIIYILYFVFIEPFLILIMINCFRKQLFYINKVNCAVANVHSFAGTWKALIILSAIIIVARGVVNIYLFNNITSVEDTISIASQWYKYIRDDALPILLLSIGARYAALNYADYIKGAQHRMDLVLINSNS